MPRMNLLHRFVVLVSVTGVAWAQGGEPREPVRAGLAVLRTEQISRVARRRVVLVTPAGSLGDATVRTFRTAAEFRAARTVVEAEWRVPAASQQLDRALFARDTAHVRRFEGAIEQVLGSANLIVVDLPVPLFRGAQELEAISAVLRLAGRRGIAVLVLDRPNPLGGDRVDGPAWDDPGGAVDVLHGLPSRHGMTTGELADWLNVREASGASLSVLPVRGWRRSDMLSGRQADDLLPAGLSAEQAALLTGFSALLHGGLDLSVPDDPRALVIRADWLDARQVASACEERLIPGVRFQAGRGDRPREVRVVVTDPRTARPLRVALALFDEIRKLHPDALSGPSADTKPAGAGPLGVWLPPGADADSLADRALVAALRFRQSVRDVLLYR
ncbi:MAG: DUF1343 domain-containing protein [Gemmatimonadetes bacterium]|nr:DUF1343 domain-containing protein [Gemmatimonadota bacterium]